MTSETLPDVSFKATAGQLNVDEAKGIVECFVAAIGNKDSVGDIVLPGAFNASLKRRKPRVVWGHNWNEPIGKVLEIYEVPANDPRMPMKMKQAGVGGLFARVQFNLKSERGREAFSNVSFFGEEQEWSIGYKTLNADFDASKQANLLKEVELYEVSPVLHGANQLTGTISIKSAKKEDEVSSFGKSKWKMFDRGYAENLRENHPDIWRAGGNIKGNAQYEILSKIAEQGGVAKTDDQIKALELREAWIARHKGDFRLPGVIAQIKWLAVGTRGEDHMKSVVREAIDRKKAEDGAVPANIDLITSELMKKVKGEVKIIEVRDTQIDFEKDGEKWTIPYADLAAGQIAFADPYKMGDEPPPPGGDKGPEMEKDIYSASPTGTPSQFGTVEREEDEDKKMHGGQGKKPHAMILLLPKNAEELAVKEGMDPNELGIILKNLGPMDNWDEEEMGKANQIIEKWAGCMNKPMRGRISGVDNMGNGMMVYRISAPDLDRMRAALSDAINLGTKPDTDDDNDSYVPNMPIGMNIPKPSVPEKPIDFDRIRTVWGERATERKLPWAESGEEEENESTEQKLNFRQRQLYESYEEVAKKFGLFDQTVGADGAHYVENSPFSKEGLICSNCVFFKGGRACEIVEGDIDPNAVCKLWIISDDLIKGGEMGKKADCGCGCGGKGDCGDPLGFKASLTDIPGAEANSSISAEVLGGRGPRRGNLEKLLRYWRPIMKRKGGFRRCVAELMDHPELAPWKPLCAWLHHETTGKWPNEGNHHGGGKAGRAAKRVLRGRKTGWSDEYGIKSAMDMDEMDDYIVDDEDKAYALKVLKQFVENESDFVKMVQDPSSWADLDDDDNEMDVDEKSWKAWIEDTECVDCEKEEDSDLAKAMAMIDEVADKVGRKISSANMGKLQEALRLLNEVVGNSNLQQKDGIDSIVIDVAPAEIFGLKELLDPIADFYGTSIVIDEDDGETVSLEIKSDDQLDAINNALDNLEGDSILGKALGRRLGGGGGRGRGFSIGKPNVRDMKPEAIDPDAIDGDNDGLVQEGTTAQRPATPRRPSGLSASRRDPGKVFDEMVARGRQKSPQGMDKRIRKLVDTGSAKRTRKENDELFKLFDDFGKSTGSRHPLDPRGETSLPSARSGAEQRAEMDRLKDQVRGPSRTTREANDAIFPRSRAAARPETPAQARRDQPEIRDVEPRRRSMESADETQLRDRYEELQGRWDSGDPLNGEERTELGLLRERVRKLDAAPPEPAPERRGSGLPGAGDLRLERGRGRVEDMTDEELLKERRESLENLGKPNDGERRPYDGSAYFEAERRRELSQEIMRRNIGPFAKLPGSGREAVLPKRDRRSESDEERNLRDREADLLRQYQDEGFLSSSDRDELNKITGRIAAINLAKRNAEREDRERPMRGRGLPGSGLSASRREFTSSGANDVRIEDDTPEVDYYWDREDRRWAKRGTGEALTEDEVRQRDLEYSLRAHNERLDEEVRRGERDRAKRSEGDPDTYIDADGQEWYWWSEDDNHGWTGPNGEQYNPLVGGVNPAGLPMSPQDDDGKPYPNNTIARPYPGYEDSNWIGSDGLSYEYDEFSKRWLDTYDGDAEMSPQRARKLGLPKRP